jgi:hypothetical protein
MTPPNTDMMAQEPAPGTREELIEALARWHFNDSLESMMAALPWEKASDYTKAPFLAEAREFMPVIVEFVGAWLLRPGSCVPWLAREWREEMAP